MSSDSLGPAPEEKLPAGLAGILERIWGQRQGPWVPSAVSDFEEILEALPVAVYTTDAAGRITFYNQAAVDLWGLRPGLGSSEWCGSWRLFRPDGTPMPHDQCPMAVALKENRDVRGVEAVAERPDGSRVHFLPYPTPLRDASGTVIGAVNMLVDLTQRRQTEERLRASEARYRELASIVEHSNDAIVSTDLDGRISSWNSGAERLYGYTSEEALGRPIAIVIPPERLDEEPQIIERIRRGEQVSHYETVRKHKDGTPIYISLTVSPVKAPDGTIIGASKIARDIGERIRAQQQQNLLVREMKHRVRNTLSTVQAIATQTLQSTSDEERASFLSRLRALSGAHDMLTSENWHRARLAEIVEGALRPFQEGRHQRIAAEGPDVWCDASTCMLITMTVHELATNATKYGALSNATGRVHITWQLADGADPRKLTVTWTESGGPRVRPPEKKGFGTRLIGHAFGEAHFEFLPEGVTCRLDVALS